MNELPTKINIGETKQTFRNFTRSEESILMRLSCLSVTQFASQALVKVLYEPDPNSFLGYLVYNGGDFFNGYAAAFGTKALLDASGRNISKKWKYAVSAGIGAAVITAAETLKLPIPIMGTPDFADIPAGLLGVACCLGISLWKDGAKTTYPSE